MKTSSLSILTLSIFLFLSLPSLSLAERCNPKDKKVLFQIKKDLGNPYHLASWDPKRDCCDWYVVECDPNTNRINALTVFQANISGQIPAAVADLPYLETLVFRHITNITGTIPEAISKLVRLKTLRLSWTNLTGPVPASLSNLKNLTFLELNFNQLTGSIPPQLAQLTNLGAIRLDRNRFTGEIPEEFGKWTGSVPDLYLSHNQLTGSVPKSLGNMNFSTIDLSRNKLVGDISFMFGKNKSTQSADYSRNMFEFDFSKVKEFPASLVSLDLNHNKIMGSIPASLTKVDDLRAINVSYNRLCGKIPTGGNLQSFDVYSYLHNKCLCGAPLPAC
ncbi:hypothetical protein RJ640_010706 [Escallonia rubra]|uniref:Polygalacturonase-inhibiting protein n=1 Tax=Escallonia rubra TaxID=112253 RepID=A0AA88UCZ7_9ASTE|nr:hypothetical protein RJ640_010706 [Escallonia rubra]